MHRVDTPSRQKDKFGAGRDGFTNGDPQTGTPATEVPASWLDAVQEEIAAVIEDSESGLVLDKNNHRQLVSSIKALIAKKAKYGAPMIGVPIDWPLAQLPQDIWPDCGMVFLSCAGQAFNRATYPTAAQLYPAGTMPELRAEFIRGWDNGRGIDSGRLITSAQGDAFQGHALQIRTLSGSGKRMHGYSNVAQSGETYVPNVEDIGGSGDEWVANTPMAHGGFGVPRVAAETRSRNMAFHKIMRVA